MSRGFDALRAAAFLVALATGAAAQAGETARDLAKAKCASCHGVDGMAVIPEAPNLAGQNRAYLVKQIMAFRSGERSDEKMSPVSLGLTDEEIAAAAGWYSAVPFEAKLPD
jgi:cytochrome c553